MEGKGCRPGSSEYQKVDSRSNVRSRVLRSVLLKGLERSEGSGAGAAQGLVGWGQSVVGVVGVNGSASGRSLVVDFVVEGVNGAASALRCLL